MPPAATSRTTAADVQLVGLPFPITWLGCLISTARPAGGTEKCPLGLPKWRATAADTVRSAAVLARGAGAAVASVAPYPRVSAPTNHPTPTKATSAWEAPIRRITADAIVHRLVVTLLPEIQRLARGWHVPVDQNDKMLQGQPRSDERQG
jgi:hypothetical protein